MFHPEPHEWSFLHWAGFPSNLVRIGTPMDGSCFFHAIAKACMEPYQTQSYGEKHINRGEFVKRFRKTLSKTLNAPVCPHHPSIRHYHLLSRGQLPEFSKNVPHYSLSNMMNELDSNAPVDHAYNEFISNLIKKDIYLLDFQRQDVYITGDDRDILYKDRDSIILLVLPGHYELVGILVGENTIQTVFPPYHPLIQEIHQRLHEKIKDR